jgi:hypothetical protein
MTDLRHLKRYLQKGEIAEIMEEVGIKKAQASNVIAGRSSNFAFVERFLQRVEKNKALYEKAQTI